MPQFFQQLNQATISYRLKSLTHGRKTCSMTYLPRFNVTTTYIDGTDIANFERAILPNTSLIYLETPNSWDFAIQDLKAVAELAKSENITTICDNSYCTPIYQKPFEYGIDLVLQSATKFISGHSDVVAGVLSGSKQMIKDISTANI